MPSDAFIGVLTGLGEAHRSRQKNIFDQEVDRRSKYEQFLKEKATDPSYHTEAQDKFSELYTTLIQTPYEKKLPKDFERQVADALTTMTPKFGQSWMGGQTTRDIMQQPMPIPSELPQPRTSAGSIGILNPSTGQLETGARGAFGPEEPLPTHQPQATPMQALMPQPPPGLTRSPRVTPQEMSQQKIAQAVQMLQALGPIHQQQKLELMQAEHAMQIEAERQKQRAEQEFAPAPPPKGFGSSAAGIYDRDTGAIKTAASPKLSLEEQSANVWLAQNPGKNLNDYQTMDANRRRPIIPELSPSGEATILNQIIRQWDKATTDVKDLNRANAIMDAGLNAARRGDMNAGSQAVLITFQKFLDPTSVVRESEYARSAEGLSMAERIKGYVDRLSQGGAGVTLPELETFATLAKDINNNLAKESTSLLAKQQDRIGRVADRYKIPRDLVFSGYDFAKGAGGSSGNVIRFRSSDGQELEVAADKWPEVLRRDPKAVQIKR